VFPESVTFSMNLGM